MAAVNQCVRGLTRLARLSQAMVLLAVVLQGARGSAVLASSSDLEAVIAGDAVAVGIAPLVL